MARRTTNVIDRFLQDYSGLDTAGRQQVSAAIKGYEFQGAPALKRTAATTRKVIAPSRILAGTTSGTESV